MRRITIVWLTLLVFLVGCSSESATSSDYKTGDYGLGSDMTIEPPRKSAPPPPPNSGFLAFADDGMEDSKSQRTESTGKESKDEKLQGGQPGSTENKVTTKLKIIKEGEIGIRVDDYHKARTDLGTLLKQYEAYIGNENERKTRYYIENTIIIRMPSKHFDIFVDKIGGIATKVDYKRIKAMDVTRQYVDIQSRLKIKKETRDKYNEFLKNAKNIEEMLAVEEKIRWLTEEIEAKEAELRYLSDRVNFSTVTLEISQPLDYQYDEPRYSEPGFGQRIGKSFANGWEGILTFMVGLTNIWPLLLFVGGVFFLIFRTLRKTSASKGGKKKPE